MHIVFITSNYPYESRPYHGAFVQELVRAIAKAGVRCTVIRPLSIFDKRYGALDAWTYNDDEAGHKTIKIWSPRYLSASGKKLLFFNTNTITQFNFNRAVYKMFSKIKPLPDVVYGHFLYPGGVVAVRLGLKTNLPSIVAVGDDNIYDHFGMISLSKCKRDFSEVRGMIIVSDKNKRDCKEVLGIPESKICMLPNGVDLSMFYPRDRFEMRKKYGFPADKFIIAFTGHFIERKGPHRVLEAVSGMDNIGLIFIGAGTIPLKGKNILYKGVLKHSLIPEMLSAADIFVLPTLMEGSCNAILEALACGLPIVTSKGEFNDDIVGDNVAIRIDPLNIEEIRVAVAKLKNNIALRNKMSEKALSKSKQYDINVRARKIVEWMQNIKKNYTK